ncbi:MAG TPA: 30S ribosomal protein S17 [Polyangia bacterium]|nr:30S ribosomal protein S17 [Polyangia bacterium]
MAKQASSPAKSDQAAPNARPASRKRELVGVVTGDKMNKTRVVTVERRLAHAKYGKYMTKREKYKAHDEKNEYRVGDHVVIVESRPLSRQKRWRVERLLKRAQEV